MSPTEQQVRFFGTFGFICFPGLFADDIGRMHRRVNVRSHMQ